MTNQPTVLVLLDSTAELLDQVRAAGQINELRTGPQLNSPGIEVDPQLLRGVDCVLTEFIPKNFDDFDSLKWIQLSSAGYSQIFGLPITDRGIRVSNGLGNFDVPMAEWNIMMLILWERNLLQMLQHQREAVWDRSAQFQSELRGKVVGFYGYGGMARETARLLNAMGIEVWALTRDGTLKQRTNVYSVPGTGDPDGTYCQRVFGPAQKHDFLSGLDYLIMAMPITTSTSGIIGESDLRLLKPTSVLLNPARAGLIDEQALLRCMKDQWIRGASIDVHYAYPLPPEHPLWSMPNVVLTPHISGSGLSPHFQSRIFDIFSRNLANFCRGQPLLNELTPLQISGK